MISRPGALVLWLAVAPLLATLGSEPVVVMRRSGGSAADSSTAELLEDLGLTRAALGELVAERCVLVLPGSPAAANTLASVLAQAFASEPRVQLLYSSRAPAAAAASTATELPSPSMAPPLLFPRETRDRTCLSVVFNPALEPQALGELAPRAAVARVNAACGAFRDVDGQQTTLGQVRQRLLSNLYALPPPHRPQASVGAAGPAPAAECARVPAAGLTERVFVRDFLARSRPVVITNATAGWEAPRLWTQQHLRSLYGSKKVHVKLGEHGVFEGVEPASAFAQAADMPIPPHIARQLPFPDLRVVRPAITDMTFGEFLDLIAPVREEAEGEEEVALHATGRAGGVEWLRSPARQRQRLSAYLEYNSLRDFPELLGDVEVPAFARAVLKLEETNIWLSAGNTVGKLHFDPFDNLLAMLNGSKTLTLYAPHRNEDLYEGHIPEAFLDFDAANSSFRRTRLSESTSMVMSPVDIRRPDLRRFPRFANASALRCTIHPGDMLFMPAFWWHEVESFLATAEQRRNLAVNFWFTPLLTKEFPCPECRLDFNLEHYRRVLERMAVWDLEEDHAPDVAAASSCAEASSACEMPATTTGDESS